MATQSKTITKYFTIEQAEAFQEKLYNKYNHVRLIGFPVSSNTGKYIWEVK